MNVKMLSASMAATVLAGGLTLSAQTQQPPAQAAAQAPAPNAVTIVACVVKESDVLKSRAAMAENAGMGDEFVLTLVEMKSDAPAQKPATDAPMAGLENRFGKVYRATGDKEQELKTYVGQRVQITAVFKNEADATRELGATGTSGSPSASQPTIDNTPELTIQSIAPAAGSCAPIVK
jgi:hypothetical protein